MGNQMGISIDIRKYFNDLSETDGIYFCDTNDVKSKFSDETEDDLFRIEDTSWWFKYRANVIGKITKRFFDKEKAIFDVGGGNGYTSSSTKGLGYNVVLLEPSEGGCRNAKKRGIEFVVCGTLSPETVKGQSLEQVYLLDVLEHIEDDSEFLKTLWAKLEQGGKALLTVPAFPILWSSSDDSAGHFRRYKIDGLRKTAEKAGFHILYINYFFEFLFLPVLFMRVGMEKIGIIQKSTDRNEEEKERITKREFQEKTGIVQKILNTLENFEINRLLKGKNIRFGSSIICVLEKESI